MMALATVPRNALRSLIRHALRLRIDVLSIGR
jgi:hypothetical protein